MGVRTQKGIQKGSFDFPRIKGWRGKERGLFEKEQRGGLVKEPDIKIVLLENKEPISEGFEIKIHSTLLNLGETTYFIKTIPPYDRVGSRYPLQSEITQIFLNGPLLIDTPGSLCVISGAGSDRGVSSHGYMPEALNEAVPSEFN
ncbi:hypothetical protein TNIN_264951 [Trichonephila inaurata madagascariensis]|uniref:Uncharacterized protein n=1 Tax=Trichonephila inaurata madagascariensis TaxID=2747483 RepID=A0A8X7CDT1_9ARAC|nr:hypothetical protein TNIN_264951 [Trichonephila inaurata madagascariensis]